MPITPEVRPATPDEIELIHWWPTTRASHKKDDPLLNKVIDVLKENPVAVVEADKKEWFAAYRLSRTLRDKARTRGVFLNISMADQENWSHHNKLYIRRDLNISTANVG